MFVAPGTHAYEGMIVGLNSRNEDMIVNPCKAKVSNMRAAGSDDAIKLPPHRTFTRRGSNLSAATSLWK